MFNMKDSVCTICGEPTGKKEIETFIDSIIQKKNRAPCKKCIDTLHCDKDMLGEGFVYMVDPSIIIDKKDMKSLGSSSKRTFGYITYNKEEEKIFRYVRPIMVDEGLHTELCKIREELIEYDQVETSLEDRLTFLMDEIVLPEKFSFLELTFMNDFYDIESKDALCCLLYSEYMANNYLNIPTSAVISGEMDAFIRSMVGLGGLGKPVRRTPSKINTAQTNADLIRFFIEKRENPLEKPVDFKLIDGIIEVKENKGAVKENKNASTFYEYYCQNCGITFREMNSGIERCVRCMEGPLKVMTGRNDMPRAHAINTNPCNEEGVGQLWAKEGWQKFDFGAAEKHIQNVIENSVSCSMKKTKQKTKKTKQKARKDMYVEEQPEGLEEQEEREEPNLNGVKDILTFPILRNVQPELTGQQPDGALYTEQKDSGKSWADLSLGSSERLRSSGGTSTATTYYYSTTPSS